MIKSRSIAKIREFCCEPLENIENYHEAMAAPEKWCCHHRWGISPVGVFSKEYLISIGLYYNRPACELVFMRESEHQSMHNKHRRGDTREKLAEAARKFFTGRKHSEETRRKISESKLGDKNPMYGKPGTNLGKKFTDEHRANMSKARDSVKQKIIASKDGVDFAVYESQMAASRALGISQGNIGMAVRGKIKQTHGYQFRRAS